MPMSDLLLSMVQNLGPKGLYLQCLHRVRAEVWKSEKSLEFCNFQFRLKKVWKNEAFFFILEKDLEKVWNFIFVMKIMENSIFNEYPATSVIFCFCFMHIWGLGAFIG